MDNFEYSIQLSDRDWANFFSAAEECDLAQASLATVEDQTLSDLEPEENPQEVDHTGRSRQLKVSLCDRELGSASSPWPPTAHTVWGISGHNVPSQLGALCHADVLSDSDEEDSALGSVSRFLCEMDTQWSLQQAPRGLDSHVTSARRLRTAPTSRVSSQYVRGSLVPSEELPPGQEDGTETPQQIGEYPLILGPNMALSGIQPGHEPAMESRPKGDPGHSPGVPQRLPCTLHVWSSSADARTPTEQDIEVSPGLEIAPSDPVVHAAPSGTVRCPGHMGPLPSVQNVTVSPAAGHLGATLTKASMDSILSHRDGAQDHKDSTQTHENGTQARKDGIQAYEDAGQANKYNTQAHKDGTQAREDVTQTHKYGTQAHKDGTQAHKDRMQAHKDGMQPIMDNSKAPKDGGQAHEDRTQAPEESFVSLEQITFPGAACLREPDGQDDRLHGVGCAHNGDQETKKCSDMPPSFLGGVGSEEAEGPARHREDGFGDIDFSHSKSLQVSSQGALMGERHPEEGVSCRGTRGVEPMGFMGDSGAVQEIPAEHPVKRDSQDCALEGAMGEIRVSPGQVTGRQSSHLGAQVSTANQGWQNLERCAPEQLSGGIPAPDHSLPLMTNFAMTFPETYDYLFCEPHLERWSDEGDGHDISLSKTATLPEMDSKGSLSSPEFYDYLFCEGEEDGRAAERTPPLRGWCSRTCPPARVPSTDEQPSMVAFPEAYEYLFCDGEEDGRVAQRNPPLRGWCCRTCPPAPQARETSTDEQLSMVTFPEAYEYFFCESEEDEGEAERAPPLRRWGRRTHPPHPPSQPAPQPGVPSAGEQPSPISFPEAYEYFFDDGTTGDVTSQRGIFLSTSPSRVTGMPIAGRALLPRHTQVQLWPDPPRSTTEMRTGAQNQLFPLLRSPRPNYEMSQEQAEDFSKSIAIRGQHPLRLVLGQGDMCMVFLAFATWAVKTTDVQAPDAWKTALLANLGAVTAIRYLRRRARKDFGRPLLHSPEGRPSQGDDTGLT